MKKEFFLKTVAVLVTLACGAQALGQDVVTYFHSDNVGSPIAATDQYGNTVWTEEYTPYGERWTTDINSVPNRQWFTGHTADKETGLVYAGARYYDPAIGRFLGMDPAGVNPGNQFSFNRYSYGNNNPYGYIDPDGREPGEAAFGLAVGLFLKSEDARRVQQAEIAAGNFRAVSAIDAGVAIAESKRAIDGGASVKEAAATAAIVLVGTIAEKKSRGGQPPGGGRGGNQFRGPDPDAQGPHTRIRFDEKGVSHYETYDHPKPGRGKRVDAVGAPHNGIPTPHAVDTQRHLNPNDPSKSRYSEGPTRPARPDEVPKRRP